MEHILKIRLQFEELDPKEVAKIKSTEMKMTKEQLKVTQRAAKDRGDAEIRTITSLQEAWGNFDWAHPITSLKNVLSGFVDSIQSRVGKVMFGLLGLLGGA